MSADGAPKQDLKKPDAKAPQAKPASTGPANDAASRSVGETPVVGDGKRQGAGQTELSPDAVELGEGADNAKAVSVGAGAAGAGAGAEVRNETGEVW